MGSTSPVSVIVVQGGRPSSTSHRPSVANHLVPPCPALCSLRPAQVSTPMGSLSAVSGLNSVMELHHCPDMIGVLRLAASEWSGTPLLGCR